MVALVEIEMLDFHKVVDFLKTERRYFGFEDMERHNNECFKNNMTCLE